MMEQLPLETQRAIAAKLTIATGELRAELVMAPTGEDEARVDWLLIFWPWFRESMQAIAEVWCEMDLSEAELTAQIERIKRVLLERATEEFAIVICRVDDSVGWSSAELARFTHPFRERCEQFLNELGRAWCRRYQEQRLLFTRSQVDAVLVPAVRHTDLFSLTDFTAVDSQSEDEPRPESLEISETHLVTEGNGADRRALVDAYIDEVFQKTGKRICRADIWKSARYTSRTEFERWERHDPRHPNRAASQRFSRILAEKPHLK